MNKSQKIFLVDIDNTLIDTEKIKKTIQDEFLKKFGKISTPEFFWGVYQEVGKEKGIVDVKEIAARLTERLGLSNNNQILDIFNKITFKKYLLPGAIDLLTLLMKTGKVVIYSEGDISYQPLKIKKSGIEKIVGESNVKISQNKKVDLKNIIKLYKDEGFRKIVIIDDKLSIIERVKEIDPAIKGIWVCSGKYKDDLPKSNESVYMKIDSPKSLYELFKNRKINI